MPLKITSPRPSPKERELKKIKKKGGIKSW